MEILIINAFSDNAKGKYDYQLYRELLVSILKSLQFTQYILIERNLNRIGDFTVNWEHDPINEQSKKACKLFDKIDLICIHGDMSILPWEPIATQVVTLINMCKITKKPLICNGFGAYSAIYTLSTKGVRFHILNGPNGEEIEKLPLFPRYSIHSGAYPSAWLDCETGDLYRYLPHNSHWEPFCNIGIYKIKSISTSNVGNRKIPVAKKYSNHKLDTNVSKNIIIEPLDKDANIARIRNVHLKHPYVNNIKSQTFVVHSYYDWCINPDTSLPSNESLQVIADAAKGAILLVKDNMLIIPNKFMSINSVSYKTDRSIVKNYLNELINRKTKAPNSRVEDSMVMFLFGTDHLHGGKYTTNDDIKVYPRPTNHRMIATKVFRDNKSTNNGNTYTKAYSNVGPIKVDPPAIAMFLYTPKGEDFDYLSLTSGRRSSTFGRRPNFILQNPLAFRQKRIELLSHVIGLGNQRKQFKKLQYLNQNKNISNNNTKNMNSNTNTQEGVNNNYNIVIVEDRSNSISAIAAQAIAISKSLNPYEIQDNMPEELKEFMSGIVMKDNSVSKRKQAIKKFGQDDYFDETPDLEVIIAALTKAEEDPEYDIQDYIEPFGEMLLIPSTNSLLYSSSSSYEVDYCPTLESIAAAILKVMENDRELELNLINNNDVGNVDNKKIYNEDDNIMLGDNNHNEIDELNKIRQNINNELGLEYNTTNDNDDDYMNITTKIPAFRTVTKTQTSNILQTIPDRDNNNNHYNNNNNNNNNKHSVPGHRYLTYIQQDKSEYTTVSRITRNKNGNVISIKENKMNMGKKYLKPALRLIEVDNNESSEDEEEKRIYCNQQVNNSMRNNNSNINNMNIINKVPMISNWNKVISNNNNNNNNRNIKNNDLLVNEYKSQSTRVSNEINNTFNYENSRTYTARTAKEITNLKKQLYLPIQKPKYEKRSYNNIARNQTNNYKLNSPMNTNITSYMNNDNIDIESESLSDVSLLSNVTGNKSIINNNNGATTNNSNVNNDESNNHINIPITTIVCRNKTSTPYSSYKHILKTQLDHNNRPYEGQYKVIYVSEEEKQRKDFIESKKHFIAGPFRNFFGISNSCLNKNEL